ncbi:hypothetical protein GN956_G7064 [Arapaima gigas]
MTSAGTAREQRHRFDGSGRQRWLEIDHTKTLRRNKTSRITPTIESSKSPPSSWSTCSSSVLITSRF